MIASSAAPTSHLRPPLGQPFNSQTGVGGWALITHEKYCSPAPLPARWVKFEVMTCCMGLCTLGMDLSLERKTGSRVERKSTILTRKRGGSFWQRLVLD